MSSRWELHFRREISKESPISYTRENVTVMRNDICWLFLSKRCFLSDTPVMKAAIAAYEILNGHDVSAFKMADSRTAYSKSNEAWYHQTSGVLYTQLCCWWRWKAWNLWPEISRTSHMMSHFVSEAYSSRNFYRAAWSRPWDDAGFNWQSISMRWLIGHLIWCISGRRKCCSMVKK